MQKLKEYQDTVAIDNNRVKDSLLDGNVDKSDIMSIVFDIFSKRKKFDYDLKERLMLYFGFMGPVFKCCRCKCFNYEYMIKVNKNFEKAVGRLEDECDIIDVLDQVRKSDNFQRNFLTRQQKILLKFDHSNIIDANSQSEENSAEEEEVLDQDEIIAKNLNSKNGLVVMLTIAKLIKILEPYIEEKKLSGFDINLFKSFYSADVVECDLRGSLGLTKKEKLK